MPFRLTGESRPRGVPSPRADRHAIRAVVNNGGLAQVKTYVPHGLATGTNVTVAGTTTYDGLASVTADGPLSFTTDLAYSVAKVGGRWIYP